MRSDSNSESSTLYLPHILRAYGGQHDAQGYPDVLAAAREGLDEQQLTALNVHLQHVRLDEASVPLSWLDRPSVAFNLGAASPHLESILHVIGGTDLSCNEVADWLEDQLGEQELTVCV